MQEVMCDALAPSSTSRDEFSEHEAQIAAMNEMVLRLADVKNPATHKRAKYQTLLLKSMVRLQDKTGIQLIHGLVARTPKGVLIPYVCKNTIGVFHITDPAAPLEEFRTFHSDHPDRVTLSEIAIATGFAEAGKCVLLTLPFYDFQKGAPTSAGVPALSAARQEEIAENARVLQKMYGLDRESADYLSRKEPFALHREFFLYLTRNVNLAPSLAIIFHSNMRSEVMQSAKNTAHAMELLDGDEGRNWVMRMTRGSVASRSAAAIEFALEARKGEFQADVKGGRYSRFKGQVLEIMNAEPRHSVSEAFALAEYASQTGRPWQEIWKEICLKDLALSEEQVASLQGLIPDELFFDKDAMNALRYFLNYFSVELIKPLLRGRSLSRQAETFRAMVARREAPNHARRILLKEGDIEYEGYELDLLARMTRVLQHAVQEGLSEVSLRFEVKGDWLEARGTLRDLARQHPSEEDPSLLKFDETSSQVTPNWLSNGNCQALRNPPAIRLIFGKNYEGITWQKMSEEERIRAIRQEEPLHSLETAGAISCRIVQEHETYGRAWKMEYLIHQVGLSQKDAEVHWKDVPRDLLLNQEVHPALAIILKYFDATTVAGLWKDPDPQRVVQKANQLEDLVRRGLSPINAYLAVQAAGEKLFSPQELVLLGRLAKAARRKRPPSMRGRWSTMPLGTQKAFRQTVLEIQQLASDHPRALVFDRERNIVRLPWIRGKKGRLAPLAARTVLVAGPGQALAKPATALMSTQEQAIRAMLRSEEYQRELRERLANPISQIKNEHVLFIFDPRGKPLGFHRGRMDEAFDHLVSVLLSSDEETQTPGHPCVWVAGVPTFDDRTLPVKTEHISRPRLPGDGLGLAMESRGHLAMQCTKGLAGTVDTPYLNVADFESLRSAADGTSNLDALLVDHPPAGGLAVRPVVWVVSANGKEPLLAKAQGPTSSSQTILEWFAKAGGKPLFMEDDKIGKDGDFSFLYSKKAGRRGNMDAEKPVDWTLSPKQDGLEVRVTYQSERGDKKKYRINVFNIPLPSSVTDRHPYFKDQTEYLVKDEAKLTKGKLKKGENPGRLCKVTARELPSVVEDLIHAKILKEADREKVLKETPMEKLQARAEEFNGSHEKAIRATSEGMAIFYDETGQPFDFVEGGQGTPYFESKFQAAIALEKPFWVSGLKLTKASILQGARIAKGKKVSFSYVGRGFDTQKDPYVVLHFAVSPKKVACLTEAVSLKGWRDYAQKGIVGNGTIVAPSVVAYLVELDGTRKVVDAHPSLLKKTSLDENTQGLLGLRLELDGVRARASGSNKTTFVDGLDSRAFKRELQGNLLRIQLALNTYAFLHADLLHPEQMRGVATAGFPGSDVRSHHPDISTTTGLFGPNPFDAPTQPIPGVSELGSDIRASKVGPRALGMSHAHPRGGGPTLSKDEEGRRDRVLRIHHRFDPATVAFLMGKRHVETHAEFHQYLLLYLKLPPAKALNIHKNLRDELFESSFRATAAMELFDDKGWIERLATSDPRLALLASIDFSLEVMEVEILGDDTQEARAEGNRSLIKDLARGILREDPSVSTARAYKRAIKKAIFVSDPTAWARKYFSKYLSEELSAALLRHPDVHTMTEQFSQIIRRHVDPLHARLLMLKAGENLYDDEELALLIKITLAAQRAMNRNSDHGIVGYVDMDEFRDAIGAATDLANERPNPDKPSLMKFDKPQRLVTPGWMSTPEGKPMKTPPTVTMRFMSPSMELEGWSGLTMGQKVQKISESPMPPPAEMIPDIIARMDKENDAEPYWKARAIVHLTSWGLSEKDVLLGVHYVPMEILLDTAMHPSLALIFKHLSPFLAKEILRSPNLERKAQVLDGLIGDGVNVYTARQVLLLDGDHHYTDEEVQLIKQVTLLAQQGFSEDRMQVAYFLSNQEQLDAAIAVATRLNQKISALHFDPSQQAMHPTWLCYKGGQPVKEPVKVILRQAGSPVPVRPGYAITPQRELEILQRIASSADQKELAKLLTKRVEEIKGQRTLFFFDAAGTALTFCPARLDADFNDLLDVLLKKYDSLWVEGIPIGRTNLLPHHTRHILRPELLRRREDLRVKDRDDKGFGRVAVQFRRGCRGVSLDTHYLSVTDFERAMTMADKKKQPLETVWQEFKPADGQVVQDRATVTTSHGIESLAVLPLEFQNPSYVWSLLREAEGQPVTVDRFSVSQSGTFALLWNNRRIRTAGWEPGEAVECTVSAKKDGLEMRVLYKKDKSRIHVLNIPLPLSITSAHPYFQNQTEYLLRTTDQLGEGRLWWPSPAEYEDIVGDIIAAEIIDKPTWEKALEVEKTVSTAQRLDRLLDPLNLSHYEAAQRLTTGLVVFYAEDGAIFDYYQGGAHGPKFKEKLDKAMGLHERFWIGGVKLTNRDKVVRDFPYLGNIRYDRRFQGDPFVAMHIKTTPQSSPKILQTVAFRGWQPPKAVETPGTSVPGVPSPSQRLHHTVLPSTGGLFGPDPFDPDSIGPTADYRWAKRRGSVKDWAQDHMNQRYMAIHKSLGPGNRSIFEQYPQEALAVWKSHLAYRKRRARDGEKVLSSLDEAARDLCMSGKTLPPDHPEWELDSHFHSTSPYVTCLFRESKNWVLKFRTYVLELIEAQDKAGIRSMRFVSLGASSGAEAYSMAAVIAEALDTYAREKIRGDLEQQKKWTDSWDVEIKAVDKNLGPLFKAARGVFAISNHLGRDRLRADEFMRSPHFDVLETFGDPRYGAVGMVRASERIRRWIQPMQGDITKEEDIQEIFRYPVNGLFYNAVAPYLDSIQTLGVDERLVQVLSNANRVFLMQNFYPVVIEPSLGKADKVGYFPRLEQFIKDTVRHAPLYLPSEISNLETWWRGLVQVPPKLDSRDQRQAFYEKAKQNVPPSIPVAFLHGLRLALGLNEPPDPPFVRGDERGVDGSERVLPHPNPPLTKGRELSIPDRCKTMAVWELLKALGLDDPSRARYKVILEKHGPEGSRAVRIRIPPPKKTPHPEGLDILDRELAHTREFYLVHNAQGYLIAVLPVLTKPSTMIMRYDMPQFFDLSSYYIEIPDLNFANTPVKWKAFSQQRKDDAEIIRQSIPLVFEDLDSIPVPQESSGYKFSRQIETFTGMTFMKNYPEPHVYETPYGMIRPVGSRHQPFVYVQTERRGLRYPGTFANMKIKSFSPEEYEDFSDHFGPKPGMHQIILPVFPTIFPPIETNIASDTGMDADHLYYAAVYPGYQGAPRLQRHPRVRIKGPGSGLDLWLAWLRTNGKMELSLDSVNPIETASAQRLAGILGIQIKEARPGERFDWILFNMPSVADITEVMPHDDVLSKRYEDMWDRDFGGVILSATVKDLVSSLTPGGHALIWNLAQPAWSLILDLFPRFNLRHWVKGKYATFEIASPSESPLNRAIRNTQGVGNAL